MINSLFSNPNIFPNQYEYDPSTSSDDGYEILEEDEDDIEEIDDIVEDLKDFNIGNNEWTEEICYDKDKKSFLTNLKPIQTTIIKESLDEKFLKDISGKDLLPEYFFKLIIDDTLLEKMCQWTNEYYHKIMAPFYQSKNNSLENINKQLYSHKKKWHDATKNEIPYFQRYRHPLKN